MNNKKYIKIKKEIWASSDVSTQQLGSGEWLPTNPQLLHPTLIERFIHGILRKHFTYGQPYCVMCGYSEDIS